MMPPAPACNIFGNACTSLRLCKMIAKALLSSFLDQFLISVLVMVLGFWPSQFRLQGNLPAKGFYIQPFLKAIGLRQRLVSMFSFVGFIFSAFSHRCSPNHAFRFATPCL